MAEDMKRNNGFIPGINRERKQQSILMILCLVLLYRVLSFLALVAIMPAFAGIFGVKAEFAQFFGGTSLLLILVGVVLIHSNRLKVIC